MTQLVRITNNKRKHMYEDYVNEIIHRNDIVYRTCIEFIKF